MFTVLWFEITSQSRQSAHLLSTSILFDLWGETQQFHKSCDVSVVLLREGFAQLQASKPLRTASSREEAVTPQLKYKYFITMATALLPSPPTQLSHPNPHTQKVKPAPHFLSATWLF